MRKSGKWMTIWDDRILEVISEDDDKVGKVSELTKNELIRISRSHVGRRCKKLADRGFLREVGDGVYLITDRGEAYLAGELDASDEAQDEPVDVEGGEGSSSDVEESNSV